MTPFFNINIYYVASQSVYRYLPADIAFTVCYGIRIIIIIIIIVFFVVVIIIGSTDLRRPWPSFSPDFATNNFVCGGLSAPLQTAPILEDRCFSLRVFSPVADRSPF
jgi:hypothetical protein